ncbi:3-octaprenyl-4-hydroxybenzoate carboxy-lyase [Arachidicoccus ginsenosidimutans]|uniref:UbiD family decarboxylase n=1 Tax=Arachidicoccus sp. BS20 TaxID=1850526 RepID=UPI0007F1481C|nr:UbiD family decarboxylase [Arachidicoccus sp. BS20]ANI88367.1 3-octaprenyl-4-hydroxybenzoate carboxy-lyase [Arachidicoccus sp. BS20]
MSYQNIEQCLLDLEKHGQLLRIKEEIDPFLEAADIQLKEFEKSGKAILFEKIKGSRYCAASNIFGTMERCEFIFRDTLPRIKELISLRKDPMNALKHPFKNLKFGLAAFNALPKKVASSINNFDEINISDLPQLQCWEKDGGAFITLPQVYSEDLNQPGIMHANLGMYRIQLSGNEYVTNKEVGLHYQIHRGIGVHQSIANAKKQPLKVSVFVGGSPAHTLAAVMPLPEGLSEMTFAGMLAGRRFRYFYHDGYCISADADFVITGEIYPNETKPEGPFGDHLGYYSLKHPFPVMRVHKVFAKRNAIWAFTVVGRPPQEDTMFGKLIHEITGDAIEQEIPGLKAVHAVDAAGVHPLLFAIGSERYTPYAKEKRPAELLTLANRILGTGQLSLAKYLFITADEKNCPDINDSQAFLQYILERINLKRDIHFQTNTTIDTLDYSGTNLNEGSKVIFSAYGEKIRTLNSEVPKCLQNVNFSKTKIIFDGVIALQTIPFSNYENAEREIAAINEILKNKQDELVGTPMLVLCDDTDFIAATINNFLWTTFTRSNPSHDIHGINSLIEHKHWTCSTLIIDARSKPHHAPPLERK